MKIFKHCRFKKVFVLLFLILNTSYLNSLTLPEINALSGLADQGQLYKKYFMDSPHATTQELWDDFLAQPSGVTQEKRLPQVVASLISYPSVIETAWLSVESLLRQEHKPDRIILNLFQDDFPDCVLPWTLQQQIKRGLEINWCTNAAKEKVSFTRSDILHPSPLIPYFSNHELDELVIIPYKAHVSLSPMYEGRLRYKEFDALTFEDVLSQCSLLGGTLMFLSSEGFPTNVVHNPSLITFKDKRFMTLRVSTFSLYKDGTFFAELDKNYQLKNIYRLIENTQTANEDARLTIKDGGLCVSYVSDVSYEGGGGYNTAMKVTLFEPGQQIKNALRPDIENNVTPLARQKNWLFFQKEESFLLINRIDPLEVWDCTKNLENPVFVCKKPEMMHDWEYGQPRASTAPLYLEEYDLWLVFFHSHLMTHDNVRTYFFGALVFDNDFTIVGYTDKPLFVSTPHIKRLLSANTILPYGCIRENEDLLLSVGINDSKAALMRLPLNRIMYSLKYDTGYLQDKCRTLGGLVNDTWSAYSVVNKPPKKKKEPFNNFFLDTDAKRAVNSIYQRGLSKGKIKG